eukprot:Hpha_TRINITY_DN35760_c0_g1::TRINITY_DN35760_c0_g1_i1::g.139829::m.139829
MSEDALAAEEEAGRAALHSAWGCVEDALGAYFSGLGGAHEVIVSLSTQNEDRDAAATAMREECERTLDELEHALARKDELLQREGELLRSQEGLRVALSEAEQECLQLRRDAVGEGDEGMARGGRMSQSRGEAALRREGAVKKEARKAALEVAELRRSLRVAREGQRDATTEAQQLRERIDAAEAHSAHCIAVAEGARARAEAAEAEVVALMRQQEALRIELRRKSHVVDAITFGVPPPPPRTASPRPEPIRADPAEEVEETVSQERGAGGVSRVEYLRELLAEKDQLVRQLSRQLAISDARAAAAEGALVVAQSQRLQPPPPLPPQPLPR